MCNPLCFLVNKFGRTAAKPLKSMILDFYDVGVLSDAKSQLMCDIRGLNLDIDMPHVPDSYSMCVRLYRSLAYKFTIL